jgi:drug/metabolite transporter (DMT)-like permease
VTTKRAPATAAWWMVALSAPAYVAVSHVVSWLNPFGLAITRTALAAAALGAFVLIRSLITKRPVLRTLRARHLPQLILLGTLGFTGYSVLLAIGQRTVAAGTTSLLLNFSSVLTVIIGSVHLGERRSGRQWAWIALGFAGTAVTVMSGSNQAWAFSPDALWILAAAVALTAFVVLQQPMLAHHDPIELTFGAAAGGLLAAAAIIPWVTVDTSQVGPSELAWVLVLGIAFTGAAYAAWAITLHNKGAGNGALLMILLPAITMGLDLVLFGKVPAMPAIIGGVLTMTSVWLATRDPASADSVTVTHA